MFVQNTEEEERGQSLIGILLCTDTALRISNWINNCLIPISRLDLSTQTEGAVPYGKEGGSVCGGGGPTH